MGYIKEPEGIDFTVDSAPLTALERKRISGIIAHYIATGEKPGRHPVHKHTKSGQLSKKNKHRSKLAKSKF